MVAAAKITTPLTNRPAATKKSDRLSPVLGSKAMPPATVDTPRGFPYIRLLIVIASESGGTTPAELFRDALYTHYDNMSIYLHKEDAYGSL